MTPQREIGQYLLDCFDTAYRVLGEGAPRLINDAYVVRLYEAARAFGGVALELREFLDDPPAGPVGAIEDALGTSLARDETGALALFCLVVVVGPRLLVSLLDAREALGDGGLVPILESASRVVVAEILASGETSRNQAPIDDASWQAAARDLTETLEEAGFVESMGISR